MVGQVLANVLRYNNVISKGDFTLKSGKKSDIYIDFRIVSCRPSWLRSFAEEMAEEIKPLILAADHLAGVPLGAIPLATLMADATDTSMLMLRDQKKEHGKGRSIEGNYNPGDSVVVVEDVVTTGGSLQRAIEKIRKEGLRVSGACAIVCRDEEAISTMKALEVPFFYLLNLDKIRKIIE